MKGKVQVFTNPLHDRLDLVVRATSLTPLSPHREDCSKLTIGTSNLVGTR